MTEEFPPSLREQFEPREVLGSGSFARVWLARDRALDRDVALKLLRDPGQGEARRRFLREAEVLARLESPHVVRVFDHGSSGDELYLVMEFLEGTTLAALPPEVDPVEVMREVAAGIREVHAADLIHRDLKPANVVRTAGGRVVLIDFGLVRRHGGHTRLTRQGVVVGTLQYLAPECLRGAPATAASDWYAWAVMLAELLRGAPPFEADAIVAAVEGRPLPAPDLDGVPLGLAGLLRDLLVPDPSARMRATPRVDAVLANPGATEVRLATPGGAVPREAVVERQPAGASRHPGRGSWARPLLLGLGLALLAVGAGWLATDRGAPPRPEPIGVVETTAEGSAREREDAASELDRRLELLLERHRLSDGGLLPAGRGKGYEAHLAETFRDHGDVLYPVRWRRFLEAFREWSLRAEPEAPGYLERLDRLESGMLHLGYDAVTLRGFLWTQTMPGFAPRGDLASFDRDSFAAVKSRLEETLGILDRLVPEVPMMREPRGDREARLALLGRGLFLHSAPAVSVEEARRRARGNPPEDALRLWTAGLWSVPNTYSRDHLECSVRVAFWRDAVAALREHGPAATAQTRLEMALLLYFQRVALPPTCDDGEQHHEIAVGRSLQVIEEDLEAEPSIVEQILEWCLRYDVGTALIEVRDSRYFDPGFKRTQRLLKRARAFSSP
jgi:hypothetical protein